MKEYVNYHCHSDKSNFAITDSPVRPIDYINRIKELGHKCYVSTEHGLSYGWVEKYLLCEKHNIKFVYGVEGYIEHDNKTYHIMLIAKSFDGMKSINRALNDAVKNNYKNNRPKLTIDIIKENIISNEVICTTACVFGILKDETLFLFKELYNIFKDNFYLEVLAHNTPMQIEFNKKAKMLSSKYGIKLIGATDSHVIYPEQETERDDLILAKRGNIYDDGDETGWYLDYPDYDILVKRFMQQGIWTKEEVEDLLDITNMINSFGDIKLNKDFKIPTIYPNLTRKERCEKFIALINEKWAEYSKNIPKEKHDHYLSEIKSEMIEWFKCSMEDYALTTYAILNKAREMGGVITTTGRGCFVGDTNVWTTNGYKKIEDVQIGDIIINRIGQFDEVVNTLRYDIKEDLIKIKSVGNKDICLTKDHKVYVYNSLSGEFKYKKAQDIKPKTDYLTTPFNINSENNVVNKYDLCDYNDFYFDSDYIYDKVKGSHFLEENKLSPSYMAKKHIVGTTINWKYRNNKLDKNNDMYKKIFNYTNMKPDKYNFYVEKILNTNKIKRYIDNDSNLMFVVGFILGDGHINKKSKNVIYLYLENDGKKDVVAKERICNFLDKYNIPYTISKVKNKNMNIMYIRSRAFYNFILKEYEIYDKNKTKYLNICKIISNNNKSNLQGLFDGLIHSDGSFDKANDCITTRYAFDNTSNNLVALFNLLVYITQNTISSRVIDNRSKHTSIKTRTCRKDYYVKDGYILSKIRCLENIINYQGFVYDLTIKNDPSFMVENVIVHNSCSSFLTNMLLGFTTVDRLKTKVPILQQRFMTADKIIKSHSTPDIDNNVADVEIFYKAQKEILGEDTNYPLIAFGTLQEKSAFKMLCKAKGNIPIDLQNEMTDRINKYSKDKLYADDEDKDSIRLEDYLDNDELLELYRQGEKYFGITTDTKRHASAFCISNDNIAELFGLCRTPSKDIVLNLEGKYMDELGYVKLDWLIVQVVEIIDLVYKKIGIQTPSAEELYNMVKNDEATWNIYKNGITCCVNQVEGSKTKVKAMKYQPKTLEELSALVAAIRPGFQSYYKRFENREHFEFGLKTLDKLLQGEFLDSSWILYQESIMLLVQWLGFEKKDSADLMKAISKKKEEKIKMISGRFHEECIKEFINNGFDEKTAKEKTESIWKVVLDASKYSFNASHSYCMALDSLYIAYAKAHYPEQTYIALIEYFSRKKKPDKVYKLRLEAEQFFGINIEPYKFRQDNRSVHIENRKVYQSLSSIKSINNEVGDIIYQLKDFKGSYLELYHKMLELGMSKDQREALIKIGYFDEFGSIGYLLWFEDNYIEYSTPRMDSIKKYYIKNQNNISLSYEDFILGLKNISVKCTEKTIKFEDSLDFFKFVLQNSKIDDIILLEKIYNQIYYLGTLPSNTTTCIVGKVIDIRNTGSILLVNAQTGEETWYGAKGCINDLKKNNIIYIPQVTTNEYKIKLPDGTYENRTSYKISSVINLTKMFNKKKGE